MKRSQFTLLIIFSVVIVNAAVWPIITAFVRVPQMQWPYLISTSVLTSLSLIALFLHGERRRWTAVVVGAVAGYLSSLLALQVAKYFDPHREAAKFSDGSYGAVDALVIEATLCVLLGGWLAGALGAFLARQFRRATPGAATPSGRSVE
ncbi:hypothetical protein ACQ86G_21555 [Roseateles chitinivorans]|uniref:hypothetical protein n=1 Tax=Roseateles chitinivorans TaxID=2917965 RepID=UPI003D672D4F